MERASKRNNYHYNKLLHTYAKENRQNLTKSAACMWKFVLSKKQMCGYQFRRERPILNFIVDFVCLELMLIIEVDGISHQNKDALLRDNERDKLLQEAGFTTLRFSSWEVLNKIGDVSTLIIEWIENNEQ